MAALARMRPRDRGTIVQVGSALAYRAIPLQSAYCGAKHAMRGSTDALRSELFHDGSRVHVTMAHLPALDTPQLSWCKAVLPNRPHDLYRPLPGDHGARGVFSERAKDESLELRLTENRGWLLGGLALAAAGAAAWLLAGREG